MEFPTYASSEISAVVAELLASQSGTALQQLNAMREALDAAARTLANPARVDQHVQQLVSRLTAAADADIRRIRDEANAALEASRSELQAHLAEHDRLAVALMHAEAENGLLKSELAAARARVESAEADLAVTVEAHAEVERRLRKLEADWIKASQARTTIENELAQAHSTVEQLLADVEQLRSEIDRQVADNAVLRDQAAAHTRAAASERDTLTGELERTRARVQGLESALNEAQQIRDQRDRLDAQLVGAGRRIQDLEHELGHAQRIREQRDQLDGQLVGAGRRIQDLERELGVAQQTREQRDQLSAQLDVAGRRIQELEGLVAAGDQIREQRDELTARTDADGRRIRELEQELSAAQRTTQEYQTKVATLETGSSRVVALEAANAQQGDQIQQLTSRLEEALQSETRLQEKLAARPAEAPRGDDADLEVMRGEVDRMIALLDASARAVTEMAATTTADDLLTELLKRLSLQFSRVALFRIKGNKLEGEQQVGFDDAATVAKVTFPLSAESILSRAANSRALESVTGSDAAARTGLPFGGAPTAAVAVPIVLQGATTAVVYADDNDMPDWARGPAVHESSVGFARILVGQVTVLLMRHTHEMKTLAELRQYATTLLQEAKEMYFADAQAGKPADQLRSRLKDNLECASQLYTYRAAMEGTAAAALFDEQILLELEESTPFAQDLSRVMADMAAGELQITAEAS